MVGTGTILVLSELQGLFSLILLGVSFLTCKELIGTQLMTQRGLSANLWISLPSFLLLILDLSILATVTSRVCSMWLTSIFPPRAANWKLSQSRLGSTYLLFHLSKITVLCCLMFNILKNIVSRILSGF